MRSKGTYVLILFLRKGIRLQVGQLGCFRFKRGYYAYVGSAFGPGGLAGRLKHHSAASDRPHWHIDYLRRAAALNDIWVSAKAERCEHAWAEKLSALGAGLCPVKGFGSSDCRCFSHLIYFERKPPFEMISKALNNAVRKANKPLE